MHKNKFNNIINLILLMNNLIINHAFEKHNVFCGIFSFFVKNLVFSKSKIDSKGWYAFRLINIKIVIQLKVAIWSQLRIAYKKIQSLSKCKMRINYSRIQRTIYNWFKKKPSLYSRNKSHNKSMNFLKRMIGLGA